MRDLEGGDWELLVEAVVLLVAPASALTSALELSVPFISQLIAE
jgi:hypothetical protein